MMHYSRPCITGTARERVRNYHVFKVQCWYGVLCAQVLGETVVMQNAWRRHMSLPGKQGT